MKNLKLFWTSTQLFVCLSIFSQTGRVTYNIESLKQVGSEKVKMINSEIDLMEFTLHYDKENSYFKKEKNIPKNDLYGKIATTLIGSLNDFYQFNNERKALYIQEISGTPYQVDHSYKMIGWNITGESTKINEYQCYKAILSYENKRNESIFEIIAWFTPEIPAPYGPIGYGGLPGLILQLQYKDFLYTATKIILNPEKLNVETIKNGTLVTTDEVVKLMRGARKVTVD